MIKSLIIFFLSLIAIEALSFMAIKRFLKIAKLESLRKYSAWIHFGLTISLIIFCISYYLYIKHSISPEYVQFRRYYLITSLTLLMFTPKAIISTFYLLERALIYIGYIFIKKKTQIFRCVLFTGLIAGIVLFFATLHGIVIGKHHFIIKESTVTSPLVPKEFDGFKIAQLSDIHIGSFCNPKYVKNALDLLNTTNPDIVVFTGDMINTNAEETLPYLKMFAESKAKYGKYAILGNHDMNDYRRWYTHDKVSPTISKLIYYEERMGFKMLRNKNIYIRKGSDSIAIAGVDNWGLPPFKQYGNLDSALNKIPTNTCKVLLSHDPSHWRQQVLDKTNVLLTLSGHTHAMQMGISIFGWTFCPSSFKYPEYDGLYKDKSQYMYVNKGLGFLGFSGRIGMWPEITVITLRSIAN